MNIIKKIGIKRFVKEINKDIKIKFQKYDMECDTYDDIVYVGETYDKRTDKYFMDFVKKIRPECDVPIFFLSLLHEVGHIMTYDIEDEENKDIIYGLLKIQFDESKKDDAALQQYDEMYFNIPLERNATEWGINFAMNNPKLIKKYMWLCK